MSAREEERKVISVNRRAKHDYFLEEFYEAGIALTGTEIKSIRKGAVNFRDAYVEIRREEAWIVGMHISPYDHGNLFNHEETRDRKLLLHKSEIRKLDAKVRLKGYTLVPTKMYFVKGRAKMEIAVARGKMLHDKRESLKKQEALREIEKAEKIRAR